MAAFDDYLQVSPDVESVKRGQDSRELLPFDEALGLYRRESKTKDDAVELRTTITELYLKRQEFERAEKHAINGLSSNPELKVSDWINEAMLFQRYRQSEIAGKILNRGIRQHPESLELVDAKARSLMFDGKPITCLWSSIGLHVLILSDERMLAGVLRILDLSPRHELFARSRRGWARQL